VEIHRQHEQDAHADEAYAPELHFASTHNFTSGRIGGSGGSLIALGRSLDRATGASRLLGSL
jgi:hypothetical protein